MLFGQVMASLLYAYASQLGVIPVYAHCVLLRTASKAAGSGNPLMPNGLAG